MNHALFVVLYF